MDRQRRIALHNLLVEVLGSNNVYFQPPESFKISYPCIIYNRRTVNALHADNLKYNKRVGYDVTYIDRDPDSDVPDKLLDIKYCSYDRHYTAENLHHDTFTIYF